MINSLILIYLTLGTMMGLIILVTSFQPDFDQFSRDFLKEEPPTTFNKIATALIAVVIWPYYLYGFYND